MTTTPTMLTEAEFRALAARWMPKLGAEQAQKLTIALATLDKRGMPAADTFSLTSITATDEKDLNLKIHLIGAPYMQAMDDGKMTMEQAQDAMTPMAEAVMEFLMAVTLAGKASWPATLTFGGVGDA